MNSTNQPCQPQPLFNLGQLLVTPGALAMIEAHAIDAWALIQRHQSGDWGNLVPHDWEENQAALVKGRRLFSSYQLTTDIKLWIITEANRAVTTLLLPEEY